MSPSIQIRNFEDDDRPWRAYVDPAMAIEELRPAVVELGLRLVADEDGNVCMELHENQEAPSIEEMTRAIFPAEEDVIGVEESGAFRTLSPAAAEE